MTYPPHPLAYMLDPEIILEEAQYNDTVTDEEYEFLMSLDESLIQSAINDLNLDFDYQDMEEGTFADLISKQVSKGAEKVIKQILDN